MVIRLAMSHSFRCLRRKKTTKGPCCTAKDYPPKSGENYQNCDDYMAGVGCGWTKKWNCPGQTGGPKKARDDGSLGYCCCCLDDWPLWKGPKPTSLPTPAP